MAVLIGIAERAAWAWLRPASSSAGEAHNVAVAIASGRGFADAFRPGQGPTDQLLPTMPVFAGGVYSVFGIDTPAAEFVLWSVAVGLAMGSYALYFRAFGRLGIPRWARVAVFCFLCLAPTYVALEVSNFRVWEGALAACLTGIFFNALLDSRDRLPLTTRRLLGMSLLAAVIFFTNPPIGVGVYAAAGLFCVLNLRGPSFVKAVAVSLAALGLLVVSWGLRNEAMMGKFMPLRDNAGLELALAQYDGALAPIDGAKRRETRFMQIHPRGPAYDKMKAVGEVAYFDNLGRETKLWMSEHPRQVARIMSMHLGQIITPPEWIFRLWGGGKLAAFRSLLASFVGILGLLGLIAGVVARPRCWCYPALLIVGPVIAFVVFQPLSRYLYLFYAPLAFSAAGLLMAAERLRQAKPSLLPPVAEAAG